MHKLGTLMRERRNQLGLTLQQVADAADCTKSYLSTIETGRRELPPSERILTRLERALHLDGGQLLEVARWDRTPSSIRRRVEVAQHQAARTQRLLSLLKTSGNRLDALHTSGELAGLVDELDSNIDARPLPLGQVPLINRVAAGYPAQFTDLDYPVRVADEYITCPGLADPQAFAARVVGDSMEPDYREGDIVIFSPDRPTPSGTDCFVRLEPDHESTFKRVYFEPEPTMNGNGNGSTASHAIRLQPLNPAYPPRTYPREAVAGLYAAAYVMRGVG